MINVFPSTSKSVTVFILIVSFVFPLLNTSSVFASDFSAFLVPDFSAVIAPDFSLVDSFMFSVVSFSTLLLLLSVVAIVVFRRRFDFLLFGVRSSKSCDN